MQNLPNRPIPMRHGLAALGAAALVAATLACNLGAARNFSPPTPPATVEASEDALDSFNNKWRDLNITTPNGPFSLSFTEAELTSAVTQAIARAEAEQGQSIPLEDVQVHTNAQGTIDVYGKVMLDPLALNGMITVVPALSPQGRVELEVTAAEFGPVDVDTTMLSDVVNGVEQTINEPIQTSPFNINLTAITVTDTEMTIQGTIAP